MTIYEHWQLVLGICAIAINLGTFVAVFWYACLTRKLREDAQEQNKLISRQIEAAQESIALQTMREEKEARPIFVWGGTNSGPDIYQLHFTNKGGAIVILETKASGCDFEIVPNNFIDRNGSGQFAMKHFSNARTNYVGIKYLTMAGEVKFTTFVFNPNRQTPDVDTVISYEQLQDYRQPTAPVFLLE